MKILFIGMSLILCLYSVQAPDVKKTKMAASKTAEWDDTLVYGPQLPDYYPNAISQYVRRIFQDSKGTLYFGTNSDGIARYDGKMLSYITVRDGLSGTQVTGMLEDTKGNLWFSTNNGITRHNPSSELKDQRNSRVFKEEDGLCSNITWNIFQDSKGTIWAGTHRGLCRFNGSEFEPVSLPEKNIWVRSIAEDAEGNLWIATADRGAFKYDGKLFRQLSKKDGLCSDDLTCILPDKQGNLWFGSMDGGLSIYNGKSFKNLTAGKEIGDNEVWNIYEDPEGTIWFTSEGFGLYSYTNGKLTHYGEKEGLYMKAVQSVYRDRSNRLWVGGGNGLYLYFGGKFVPVTKNGPWEEGC